MTPLVVLLYAVLFSVLFFCTDKSINGINFVQTTSSKPLLPCLKGNIVEIILSIAALQKGLFLVVQYSLIGSILSNLLLVLGCCFLFGGIYFKVSPQVPLQP